MPAARPTPWLTWLAPLLAALLGSSAGLAQDAMAEVPPVPSGAEEVRQPPPAPAPRSADEGPTLKPLVRVAVQDLAVTDVDARVAQVVADSLLVELRKLEGVSVIGMDEVRAMLDQEAARQMTGCDDASCLADIAGALGAEILVVGSLARVGDEHVFGLRRIQQAEARVVGTVSRRLVAEDGEEFLAAIGPAVAELFPDYALRPGKERGVAEEEALRLNPPPLDPWAFYVAAGASGLVLSLGSTALLLNLVLGGYYRLVTLPGLEKNPGTWASLQGQQLLINATLGASAVLLGGAVLLAAGAGGLYPFVDWQGYGDDGEEP